MTTQALFTPTPLFSEDTRNKAIDQLREGLAEGLITEEEMMRAEKRLFTQIPSQEVPDLLHAKALKVVPYKCIEIKDDKPVLVRRVEIHPIAPNASDIKAFQLYESRDNQQDDAFMTDLYEHIDAQGWLCDSNKYVRTIEHPDLYNDPTVTLRDISFRRFQLPAQTTNYERQNDIYNFVRQMSSVNAILNDNSTPPHGKANMPANLSILQGKLTRYLRDNLNNMTVGELKMLYEQFTHEVSSLSYSRALDCLNSVISDLPEEARMTYIDLLWDCVAPLNKDHDEVQLIRGLPSPYMKTIDNVTSTLQSAIDEP